MTKAVSSKTKQLAKSPQGQEIERTLKTTTSPSMRKFVKWASNIRPRQIYYQATQNLQKVQISTLFTFASYFGYERLFRVVFSKFGVVIALVLAIVVYQTFYKARKHITKQAKRFTFVHNPTSDMSVRSTLVPQKVHV